MRAFRESGDLKPAAASFRQGWREAQQGEASSVATLWDGSEVTPSDTVAENGVTTEPEEESNLTPGSQD